ncbi:MAG: DsbA family protein [Bryobacteraceae bacterium]|nr:DsbA family protein [Bryobacteraceae bacterium]MDW8379987.1 thioredoxin domain-containing protein [Bryobacterales bacterium]
MSRLIEGNPTSAVQVLIYEDLQCPDCRNFHHWLQRRLLPTYGDRVAFLHYDFPLPQHDWARPAAIAAKHFDAAGLGARFRRQILDEIPLITADSLKAWIAEFASSHNASPEAALEALASAQLAAAVDADSASGLARGVQKTPTVFVNNQAFVERFSYEELATALDQALLSLPQEASQ